MNLLFILFCFYLSRCQLLDLNLKMCLLICFVCRLFSFLLLKMQNILRSDVESVAADARTRSAAEKMQKEALLENLKRDCLFVCLFVKLKCSQFTVIRVKGQTVKLFKEGDCWLDWIKKEQILSFCPFLSLCFLIF